MSKHTPGPWTGSREAINAPDGTLIASVHFVGVSGPILMSVGHANARLIAAAPEMLEALHAAHLQIISLLNEGDFKRNVELDLSYLVDAIAKAEGKLDIESPSPQPSPEGVPS